MATNVKGNWKEGFKKTAKQGWKKTKKHSKKGVKQLTKGYGMYGAPTVGLFKGAGRLAMKPVKLALRFPGTGLIATGAYYGAKALGKKYGRKYHFSPVRQFDKKGRKII